MSEALLDEYEDAMQRRPFCIARRAAAAFRGVIERRGVVVRVRPSRPLLKRDQDDDIVLKTAIAGKAELLVTRNRTDFEEIAQLRGETEDLQYRGVKVATLVECLATIRAQHADAKRVMRRRRHWP